MATKRPAPEDSYESVMTCPVCMEEFTDARLLSCGHHFCFKCLQKISQDQASITCPTCRFVTKDDLQDLHTYRLNEFQAKVTLFLSKKRAKIEKRCGFCEDQTPATFTCKECQLHLCNTCKEKHKPLEEESGHQVSPISEYKVCSEHQESHAHCYCDTCDKYMCPRCVVKHENSHKLLGIKAVADKARQKLRNLGLTEDSLKSDRILTDAVEASLNTLKKERDEMEKYISEIRNHTVKLLNKIEHVEKEMVSTYQREIKELEMLLHDSKDFLKTKKDLINHVTDLLKASSDCEVINREKDFPIYKNNSVRRIFTKLSMEMPCTGVFKLMAQELNSIANSVCFTSIVKPIILGDSPLGKMHIDSKFVTEGGIVHGLAYNSRDDTYIVRSNNPEKLIQVYKPDGQISKCIGSDISGICNEPGDIAVDTKRNLYLLPTSSGDIVRIDTKGNKDKTFDITKYILTGISYINENDEYVVSGAKYDNSGDVTKEADNSVYIVDAENGTTKRKTKKITRDPYFVCWLKTPGKYIPYNITVIVSEHSRFGDNYIRAHNQWWVPSVITKDYLGKFRGICTDLAPEIILSYEVYGRSEIRAYQCLEKSNYRVLFTLDKGQKPNAIAYDWRRRRIILGLLDSDEIYILKEVE